MAYKMQLPQKIIKFLAANPEKRFTVRAIAEHILEKYPKECEEKIKRTSIKDRNALLSQLEREVGSSRRSFQKQDSRIKRAEVSPREYYWTANADQTDGNEAKTAVKREAMEFNLYPLLCAYLWSEFRVYPKRINEKKSSNKRGSGGNLWLHPDIVGMEDLTLNWREEVTGAATSGGGKKTKLWSFEVKRDLKMPDVRQAYFQAVSNSSWANLGYLVTNDIGDDETMRELRMLSSLHGIGLIKLNADNPPESDILIPAKEKPEVDWGACNRVAEENDHFLGFIKSVRSCNASLHFSPSPKDWDLPEGWDSDD